MSTSLRITVVYYHENPAVFIDNDNMVKPIQDALNGLRYAGDRLITDTVIRKTPIECPILARGASLVLLGGFSRGKPFVHIQVDAAPDHTQTL